ncbi:MAG: hypothetical protein NZ516_11485, partial [Raineya sp.]|nr:hypothetical protein [Raineya sp.]
NFQNDLIFQKKEVFQDFKISHSWRRFYWSANVRFSYLYQNLQNNFSENTFQRNDWLTNLFLMIRYKVSSVSSWSVFYQYHPQTFSTEYFYTEPILFSARSQRSNQTGLHLQNSQTISTFYTYNDLFEQFLFNVGLNHNIVSGNYFSNLSVQPTRTQSTYFFLPQAFYSTSSFANIEKYLREWFLLIKANFSYGYSIYYNIVNNSDLRLNFAHSYRSQLELKTGFKMKLNFQNIFNWAKNSTQSVSGRFDNQNLNNSFSIIYRQNSQNYIWLTFDYFVPNLQNQRNNYKFVDVEYRYKFKNKPIDLSLHCKNLLNEQFFEQVQTSDFAISVYRNNLLPRYFLISVSCNL